MSIFSLVSDEFIQTFLEKQFFLQNSAKQFELTKNSQSVMSKLKILEEETSLQVKSETRIGN